MAQYCRVLIFTQTQNWLENPHRIIVRNEQFSGTLPTYMHCVNNAHFAYFLALNL